MHEHKPSYFLKQHKREEGMTKEKTPWKKKKMIPGATKSWWDKFHHCRKNIDYCSKKDSRIAQVKSRGFPESRPI